MEVQRKLINGNIRKNQNQLLDPLLWRGFFYGYFLLSGDDFLKVKQFFVFKNAFWHDFN